MSVTLATILKIWKILTKKVTCHIGSDDFYEWNLSVYPWEIKKVEEEQKKILNMHFGIFCQNSDFGVKNWFEDIFMISNILNCIF